MRDHAETSAGIRILKLLDTNSFVEFGAKITARNTDFNIRSEAKEGDGVITGYGLIEGNLVYVFSQDASVLGGSIGEMHARKILSLYDLAMKTGAPVIGFLDCAGLRLQEAADSLDAFGSLYRKMSEASGVIPQICAIFGQCGGGLAMVPALSDYALMAEDARLFVNSPNTFAANHIGKCDTASAQYQAEKTGLIDFVGTEEDVLAQIRALVPMLPANYEESVYDPCTDDLNRLCEGLEAVLCDPAVLLSNVADHYRVIEKSPMYAPEMFTGLIQLNGMTIGAFGNRTGKQYDEGDLTEYPPVLTADGCRKAAEFIRFCDAFNIPVLSVTDAEGFAATTCNERNMARAGAALACALADATVPKINLLAGKAYGSAYALMNSRGLGADLVIAWPGAVIGMMDAKMAAKIMYAGTDADLEEKAAEYEGLQNSLDSAASRGYVDVIVEPADTRKYLIGAFEMLYTKKMAKPDKKHGTVL